MAGTLKAVSNLRNNDVCMIEMRVPGGGGVLAERGMRVGDLMLPHGSLVAAVYNNGNLEVATQDMKVFPGDNVIVLSDISVADKVRELLRSL